jgi:hypothetical protein
MVLAVGCTPPIVDDQIHALDDSEGAQAVMPLASAAAPTSAEEVDCDGSFDLALEFLGIAHLVSPRIEQPQEIWVHFPMIDEATTTAKIGVELPRHEPRLYLPKTGIVLSGVETLAAAHCPPDVTPCQAISLQGLDLRIEGVVDEPLSAAWTNDDPDRSLLRLANFDELTKQSLDLQGKTPLPQEQTFADLQRVPFTGDGLAARFRATAGHVQTATLWDGDFRTGFVPGGTFGPALPKLARSFEVVSPVEGCATLWLTNLWTGAEAGSIRIGSTQPVRVIAEHAPTGHGQGLTTVAKPCDNLQHLKAHYLLRSLPPGTEGDKLLVMRDAPGGGQPMSCDPNCSPGCSKSQP